MENNGKAIFIVPGCNNGNIGSKFDGDLSVTYTKESLLVHTISGSVRGEITTGTTTTSSNTICQNAEDNELCDGLNIVFGEGYKEACCSEYPPLCC